MRLGRSRPIPTLLLRRAAPQPPVTATASLSINAQEFHLPWPEDFSSGDWSRWVASPASTSLADVAVALTVSGGAGVIGSDRVGLSGGVRAYAVTPPGSVASITDQGATLTATPSHDFSSDRLSVVLRGNGTWGAQDVLATAPRPGTGYRLVLIPGIGAWPVIRIDSSGGTVEVAPDSVADSNVVVSAGVPIRLRFEVVGYLLRWRSWLVGDPEPTTWATYTDTDSTAASGIFGLSEYSDNVGKYTVDDISWYVPAGVAPGAATGTAAMALAATAATAAQSTATAALSFAATATATVPSTPTSGTASLTFAASGAAAAPATATAALTVTAGTVTAKAAGTASATLSVNATATPAAPTTATAALAIAATATAKAPASGLSATLTIAAAGTGKAPASGTAQLTVTASAVVGGLPATGTASLTLAAGGIGNAPAGASAALTIAATLTAAARAATLAALTINAGTTAGATTSAQAALDLAAALTAAARAATTAALTLAAVATPATQGGYVKVWAGAEWLKKPAKIWTGTAWPQKPVKVWTGTAWKTTT